MNIWERIGYWWAETQCTYLGQQRKVMPTKLTREYWITPCNNPMEKRPNGAGVDKKTGERQCNSANVQRCQFCNGFSPESTKLKR